MTRLHLLAAAALCALLTACASVPGPATTGATGATLAAYQQTIELNGRLSVSYEKDGKNESMSGKFNWQQSAARTDVSLASPLGQTIARISVTPDAATLTQSGQAPRVASDIDTLSAQALGWQLPVSGLRDWLQGYAVDASGGRYAASPEHSSVTTRDGWRLTYVSWQDGTGARALPKRIDAERSASASAAAVSLRIVIDAPVAP